MGTDRNVKLNLLKGFACIGIVFIHVTFPGLFGQIVQKAACFAVPVFFMTAGYYAFGKENGVIRRRTSKILRIFAAGYVLFFLNAIAAAAVQHEAADWLAGNFTWKTPVLYTVFCTVGFAIPLWYLIAMAEVYAVWMLIVRKGREDAAVKWIPALFVIRWVLTIYCTVKELDWFWHVNFLTQGMPWFLLGYYLRTDAAKWARSISFLRLATVSAAGCVIAVIPTALQLRIEFSSVGSILFASGLFLLTLRESGRSVCKPMEFIGAQLSLPIYILHVPVDSAVNYACRILLHVDTTAPLYAWCRPILALVSTVFASWVVYTCMCFIQKMRTIRKVEKQEETV